MKPVLPFLLAAVFCVVGDSSARAQLSYGSPGGNYSQNFDTLANAGTGNAWTNNTTLAGWFLFRQPAPGTALTAYDASTGSSTTGTYYSFGAAGSAERALGSVGSGGGYWGSPGSPAVAGWSAVGFTNNTGITLNQFTVTDDGEQWRDGGAATPVAQTMVQEYGFGASFGAVATWIPTGFNFTSPVFVNTTTGAAVNGNGAGLIAGIGGTVTGQSWVNGDTLWIRWIENNDAGNDHGLAVDNFSFSANVTPVPEPTTIALAGLGAAGVAYWRWRRRRSESALAVAAKEFEEQV